MDVRFSPWPLQVGRVEDLRLIDGGRTAIALVGGNLAVIDVETGVEWFASGTLRDGLHAAVALERQTAPVLSPRPLHAGNFPTMTTPETAEAPERGILSGLLTLANAARERERAGFRAGDGMTRLPVVINRKAGDAANAFGSSRLAE